jgi:hypothetical protein
MLRETCVAPRGFGSPSPCPLPKGEGISEPWADAHGYYLAPLRGLLCRPFRAVL